jgi:hypothetical protein
VNRIPSSFINNPFPDSFPLSVLLSIHSSIPSFPHSMAAVSDERRAKALADYEKRLKDSRELEEKVKQRKPET